MLISPKEYWIRVWLTHESSLLSSDHVTSPWGSVFRQPQLKAADDLSTSKMAQPVAKI